MSVTLELPEPPSVNAQPTHRMVNHSEKRSYQRIAWARACSQKIPPREPPARVTVDAHFRLHMLRDDDNLRGSLKWVLDALRQKQDTRDWRQGIFEARGFFVDDNPEHLTLGEVTQEIDRKNRGVTLTIRAA